MNTTVYKTEVNWILVPKRLEIFESRLWQKRVWKDQIEHLARHFDLKWAKKILQLNLQKIL